MSVQLLSQELAYYRLPVVLQIFQISKSKLYGDVQKGIFPAPVKLGARTSVWSAQSLQAFAQKLELKTPDFPEE